MRSVFTGSGKTGSARREFWTLQGHVEVNIGGSSGIRALTLSFYEFNLRELIVRPIDAVRIHVVRIPGSRN